MEKKKINAFTLVELLAVIVILAIILVIAVPKITKVIEQSKMGALESSGKLIAGSLENKYKEELALGTDDISTSTEKACPDSMYDSNLYSCTYTLDSDTGKASLTLIGKTGSKFEKLGVNATTTEAESYKLGEAVTVTFDSQGGSEVAALSLTSGEAYGTLSKPAKSGLTFDGWYTEAEGGTKVTSTSIVNSNITLYAHFVETVELSSSWKAAINEKTVGSLTLFSIGGWYDILVDGSYVNRYRSSNIKSIKFYDDSSSYDTTGKTFIANVSSTGETIKAYGVVDSTDSTKIDIDIVGDKLIAFPSDSSYLFYDLSYLNVLDFNNSITTSNVINMSHMFYGTGAFSTTFTLDVSSFDTSNVTNMAGMFCDCTKLKNLDLSNFDTSNVTNMDGMFAWSTLTSLDLRNFDTSNVTNMSSMFINCSSLTSLDLSNFNTSNVTSMSEMFSKCNSLTSLNVSSFDTSSVTDFSYMFCETGSNNSSFSVDTSNFDISSASDSSTMFECKPEEVCN